ncbi:glycine cleavage system aminomethyltransferase GcvT [Leptospirillum ferriphilum]|uniref:glycine cleavage system aminomethyltransferase GcvT n=1 Tax=Leptospirillum ferriphilum TaxID=178606 RepID=UPI0006B20221|nr:glycine cleavage system aminomethyltransferase GcvT [Leptospirillum ferriphilum]
MNVPLHDIHLREGGHMVDFHGYTLPVRFSSILEESLFVREKAGLFDISHMGHFVLRGKDALGAVNRLITSNLENVPPGKALYGHLLNPAGGVIDDIMAYHFGRERVDLVVNASNRDGDARWIREHLPAGIELEDFSPGHVGMAVQGPRASRVLEDVLPGILDMRRRETRLLQIEGGEGFLVSRTGYTGEDGWEFFGPAGPGVSFYEKLLHAGKKAGILACCGLGARDLLRLEMGYPLYGQELNDRFSPFDAGLAFAVSRTKSEFIGRTSILESDGQPRIDPAHPSLGGFVVEGRGIPRTGCPMEKTDGTRVGEVTSGGFSPRVGSGFGLAYLDRDFLEFFRNGGPGQVRIHGIAHPVRHRMWPFVSVHRGDSAP